MERFGLHFKMAQGTTIHTKTLGPISPPQNKEGDITKNKSTTNTKQHTTQHPPILLVNRALKPDRPTS